MTKRKPQGNAQDASTGPYSDQALATRERQVPEQEKDEVKKILARIGRAKQLQDTYNNTILPRLRRLQSGAYKSDSEESQVRTNLIFATQATLLPHTYAKNPEIAVTPTESVSDKGYEAVDKFCKTAQIAINRFLVEEAKLKPRVKSNIRSAMATSVGWLKLSFQHSLTAGDPLILRRAQDMQDNLRRVEYLIQKSAAELDPVKLNQQREELKSALKGLLDNQEVKTFKGFALDRVMSEDIFILDESIKEFDEYVDARAMAHRIWMSDEEFERTFGFGVPVSATKYAQPAANANSMEAGATPTTPASSDANAECFRAVYEVWDREANVVYVVCEGMHEYCRPPAAVKHASERWYPFFCLGFNVVEGRWRPLADTELLEKLQEEYNRTRYLFAEARKEAIPTWVFRKAGGLTEEDIEALKNRKSRRFIGVEGNPSVPIKQDIDSFPGVVIDPVAYDVTLIRNDMDMMVGLSDASRSNLIQAKTATEAEIMKQALMTRVAERQDANEDMIGDIALSVLQIALRAFSAQEIGELCGEGAAEAWPKEDLTVDTIFRKVRVMVKAGSSGKPNIMKERESWAQVMPIIQKAAEQVYQFRTVGQFDLANSAIELLRETLQRFDEKIDVERFVPKQEVDDKGQPVNDPRNQAMQQVQQMQQQMQELQQQFQQCQQELQQCQMDLKVEKQGNDVRKSEAEAKAAVEVARETSKAQRDEQLFAQKHQKDMDALAAKEQRERADDEAKSAREVADIEAQGRIDAEKEAAQAAIRSAELNAKLRESTFNAAVSAASTIMAKRMEPKPGKDGAVVKGEDLSPKEIGDGIVVIVTSIMSAVPQFEGAAMQQSEAGAAERMVGSVVEAVKAMQAAMSRPRGGMRIVVGDDGMPTGMVPADAPETMQ